MRGWREEQKKREGEVEEGRERGEGERKELGRTVVAAMGRLEGHQEKPLLL